MDDYRFRLIKAATPGSYTFILRARREVPKRTMHARRKTNRRASPAPPGACGLEPSTVIDLTAEEPLVVR